MEERKTITRQALSTRQRRTLDWFVAYAVRTENRERRQRGSAKLVHFKTFELHPGYNGTVYVAAEVGMRGDEDTLASILCRDRYHFAISMRGAVQRPPKGRTGRWVRLSRRGGVSWWDARQADYRSKTSKVKAPKLTVDEMVSAVKTHALIHYERGGWSYVTESYTDAELADLVRQCSTRLGAIRAVGKVVKLLAERDGWDR